MIGKADCAGVFLLRWGTTLLSNLIGIQTSQKLNIDRESLIQIGLILINKLDLSSSNNNALKDSIIPILILLAFL